LDKYYEEKKRRGYIFTLHDIDPKLPYVAMEPSVNYTRPVEMPGVVSWWSHLSGRYRNSYEQKEYIRSGCIDRKLPERR
jgi:hypothetical protein